MDKKHDFTISVLWDTQIFLKYLSKGGVKQHKLKAVYLDSAKTFNILKLDYTLQFCIKCDLISLSDDSISLTDRGGQIASLLPTGGYSQPAARTLLELYIRTVRPTWSFHLIKGRQKSMNHVPESISDVFIQLGLYDRDEILIDSDTVEWWDRLATVIYSTKQSNNVTVGRIGERLTFLYEEDRTGYEPKWLALEDNGLGYDLLSRQSPANGRNLCIEVKTCSSAPQQLFISKYEWKVATTKPPGEHLFHVWDITNTSNPTLYTPSAGDLEPHIPSNVGVGEWETCSLSLNTLLSSARIPVVASSDLPSSVYELVEKS